MKLETTNKKKYPCEQCAEGIYMSVEDMWWCDKYLEYACGMEMNHLCEKFKRDGEQTGGSGQVVLDMATASNEKNHKIQESLAIERYQDLVDYFDDKDVAKTILGSREEFKKWLERIRWHVRKIDELARKVDQKPCEDAISRQAVLDMATVIETDDYSGNEIMEVVDTEDIKALPSVTPTSKPEQSCEDAVSREAVLAIAGDSCLDLDSYEDAKEFCNEIKELPPITPAPKKSERAHWIDNHNGTISCSYCHTWFYKNNRYYYMRHCPNCGAKMEVKE